MTAKGISSRRVMTQKRIGIGLRRLDRGKRLGKAAGAGGRKVITGGLASQMQHGAAVLGVSAAELTRQRGVTAKALTLKGGRHITANLMLGRWADMDPIWGATLNPAKALPGPGVEAQVPPQ